LVAAFAGAATKPRAASDTAAIPAIKLFFMDLLSRELTSDVPK
jgi:hypothetical protein